MDAQGKIKVLFASAEASPLVKIGGLGDVAGALPAALSESSAGALDIRLFLPYHADIKRKDLNIGFLGTFPLPAQTGSFPIEIYVTILHGIKTYLLDSEIFNHNSPVYHGDPALDGRKYAAFSVALLEACRFLNWRADILHANDWHTALAVYALKTLYKNDPFFEQTRSVLTIHNLPYNGYGSESAMTDLGFPPGIDPDLPDWALLTPLPLGISTADKIVTVSPNYTREIQTRDFGCGMHEYLQKNNTKIFGILNGIDTKIWNPSEDPFIPQAYDSSNINLKALNKSALQRELNLEEDADIPLLTVVSRFDYQKGLGLIFDAIPENVKKSWQMVLLGTGAADLEARAADLMHQYPHKIVSLLKYDEAMAHKLYAGGDIFVMPSLYEPCGLSQMIAMRYGNIPVARATGGLQDSIVNYHADSENATGFLFTEKTYEGLVSALNSAILVFGDKPAWSKLIQNAMKMDFSWKSSAQNYLKIYQELFHQRGN
ncbi:MAG TPA: glycogen/starch synthase [Anaerolineaceae bacterium]|jgi:starch synthase|nr:glycogen synthase [Anaerolineaceae bacterium]HOA21018.1 glycogen/starch synthase [Anaerolineaceae bacterium]HOG76789.1 glycogen/starch synthase [Anaerolineaceae bacterium]